MTWHVLVEARSRVNLLAFWLKSRRHRGRNWGHTTHFKAIQCSKYLPLGSTSPGLGHLIVPLWQPSFWHIGLWETFKSKRSMVDTLSLPPAEPCLFKSSDSYPTSRETSLECFNPCQPHFFVERGWCSSPELSTALCTVVSFLVFLHEGNLPSPVRWWQHF